MKSSFSLSSLFVVLFFLALVVVPVVRYGGKAEPAGWAIANARHLYNTGDRDNALRLMREALVLAEGVPVLEMDIARWFYQNGHAVMALELIERLIESNDDDSLPAYGLAEKSNCLSYMGRYREALQVSIEMYELDPDRTWTTNDLAYHRGLAGIEMESALEGIQRVLIEHGRKETLKIGETNLPFLEKTIVAISIASLSVDRQFSIIKRLDPLIDAKREKVGDFQEIFSDHVYQLFAERFMLTGEQERGAKKLVGESESTKRSLAVLLTCRALLYQDSGNLVQCDEDRREVMRLGQDPDKLVSELPNEMNCLGFLSNASAWLDTRGVVFAGLKSNFQAKRDYDYAIMAYELVSDRLQRNSYQNEMIDVRQVKRKLATLIDHRMQFNKKMGDLTAVARDQDRIENLGFIPGKGLF